MNSSIIRTQQLTTCQVIREKCKQRDKTCVVCDIYINHCLGLARFFFLFLFFLNPLARFVNKKWCIDTIGAEAPVVLYHGKY